MKIDGEGVDFVSAPKDYASLFQTYYEYVKALVRTSLPHHGVRADFAEDIASEILAKFLERDFLNVFDPSLTFEYNGEIKHARFKSFLSKFVITYLPGICARHRKIDAREQLVLDQPVSTSGGEECSTSWAEAYGHRTDAPPEQDEIVELLSCQAKVRYLRDYLLTVPRRSKYDICDLPKLFDAMLEQYRTTGEVNIPSLRPQFGNISATAIYNWVHWLRINCAKALERPEPQRRARASRSKSP